MQTYEDILAIIEEHNAKPDPDTPSQVCLVIAGWDGPALNFFLNPRYELRNSVLISPIVLGNESFYYFRSYDREELDVKLPQICGIIVDGWLFPRDSLHAILEKTLGDKLADKLDTLFVAKPRILGDTDSVEHFYKYYARHRPGE